MIKLTMCCDVYHAYEKVGRFEIVDSKLIKNEVYTDNMIIRPFPATTPLFNILEILRGRVICESRCDKGMLNHMGLDKYNWIDIFRHTHGVDIDDCIWFKFDEDPKDLTWDDVRVR